MRVNMPLTCRGPLSLWEGRTSAIPRTNAPPRTRGRLSWGQMFVHPLWCPTVDMRRTFHSTTHTPETNEDDCIVLPLAVNKDE